MRPFELDQRIQTVYFTQRNATSLLRLLQRNISSNDNGLFNSESRIAYRVEEAIHHLDILHELLEPLYDKDQAEDSLCDLKDVFGASEKLQEIRKEFDLVITSALPNDSDHKTEVDDDISLGLFGIEELLGDALREFRDLIKTPLAA